MQKYLSRQEAAEYLLNKYGKPIAVGVSSLNRMACFGGGPKFIKLAGGRAAYTPKDLDAWAGERIKGAA